MKTNIKNNLFTIIITSIITLMPMVAGILMWDKLPDVLTTHWGADGVADGTGSKAFAVFGIPLIMLVLHWVCIIATSADRNNQGSNRKMFRVVLWLIPVISIFINAVSYIASFGIKTEEIDIKLIAMLLIGVLLIVIGNYLPKCKRNSTMGIKLSWTLANDENWNRTHRLGGKVWMLGGLIIAAMAFVPAMWGIYVMIAVFAAMIIIPMVYSYAIHRRQVKDGTVSNDKPVLSPAADRTAKIITAVFLPIILIGAAFFMFTGSVDVQLGEEAMTIDASYWDDAVIAYDSIADVEYRENGVDGVRLSGFGSARLSLGLFENEEFGQYIRYTCTGSGSCIVLTADDGRILVLSGADTEDTQNIYDELTTIVNK